MAPFNEELTPQKRTEAAIELSELVIKIVTHVICHTIVDYQELLSDERLSVAHAFLQRVSTTHMCNHKLTTEGLVYHYQGQTFQLHEEYKTMALTRSVYEHLAMFYFLYEHPKTQEERDTAWKNWQEDIKDIAFNQAWKYLFKNKEMALLYRHLSMHCHPVYKGLLLYQSQSASDQGEDAIPLHLSSSFLAYLCQLFLKLVPQGSEMLQQDFSRRELFLFNALALLTKE